MNLPYVIFFVILLIITLYFTNNPFIANNVDTYIGFTTDYRFEEPPDTINLENEHDCMGELKCSISDAFSCSGCKSLLSSCVHLDVDTKVLLYDGSEIILSKNETEDEGYCLQIKKVNDSCSPQGDLVFVSSGPDSYNYQLICLCKNPGLIGNETINGDCTTVYMCNGQIDNINKPLNEINCICPDNQINTKNTDGYSFCKEKIFTEDFSNQLNKELELKFTPAQLVDVSKFNINISQNSANYSKFVDPCAKCPITGKSVSAQLVTDQGFTFCGETEKTNNFILAAAKFDGGNVIDGFPAVPLALYWESVVIFVGQTVAQSAYYLVKKEGQDLKFNYLFGDNDYIYIKAAGNLLHVNLLRGFSFNSIISSDYSAYTTTWDLRVGPYNSSGYTKQVARTTETLTNHRTSYTCPWFGGIGCDDWDSSYSSFGLLFNYNGAYIPTNSGLMGTSQYFKKYGVFGYAVNYKPGTCDILPIKLDGSAGDWIKSRMFTYGAENNILTGNPQDFIDQVLGKQ